MTNNHIRNRERDCALKQLMAYDFAQLELNLFLDTHPNDQRALREFHRINKKAIELREMYEANFGPITTSAVDSTTEWTWINSPWPWEN